MIILTKINRHYKHRYAIELLSIEFLLGFTGTKHIRFYTKIPTIEKCYKLIGRVKKGYDSKIHISSRDSSRFYFEIIDSKEINDKKLRIFEYENFDNIN
jgi:hypothetical protein